jgi:hypothetical protein
MYVWSLYLEVYDAKPGFGVEKMDATGVYPCLRVLVVVCCGVPHAGAEPSIVVQW